MAALLDAGRSVPDDVSVVGFDDIVLSAHVEPALTTVKNDFGASGRIAIQRLLGMIDTTLPAPTLHPTPPSLVVRGSTTPADDPTSRPGAARRLRSWARRGTALSACVAVG